MPYTLLNQYKNESNILSKAYELNENYYLFIHKILTYPIIILSAFSTVIAGLRKPELEFLLLGLSLGILIFSGFNTAVQPKDKQFLSNKISTEFSEISLNINQFIKENSKTKEEVKAYSQKILSLFEVWKSMAGEIHPKHLARARLECAVRVERISHSSKKKEIMPLKEITLQI